MARNKKRKGHPYRKPAAIPARQRVKGSVIWAILFSVFAILIAGFAAGLNYIVLVLAGIAGAIVGYVVGKKMESEA
jgi:hypothetical protein